MTARSFRFDPGRVAYFEAHGWRAYYDRRWFRMARLIVALCQEQFHIPFPVSLLAGYYTARASIAWVPVDHDEARVRRYLEQFYALARRYSNLRFDVAQVADLELRYFEVHRRLAGVADKSEFIEVMTQLHAALFDIPAAQARESARLRVQAAETVDRITSHTSTNVERDWATLEEELRQCYLLVQRELSTSHP